MNNVSIRSVIVSSVHRLSVHQVSTERTNSVMYVANTMDYDFHHSLADELTTNPSREPGKTVMMDCVDSSTITSPAFATMNEVYAWAQQHFPQLMKVGLIDANKNKLWTYDMMSPRAINKAWIQFVQTGAVYPDTPKPSWVDPLRLANTDPSSGDFIENIGFN